MIDLVWIYVNLEDKIQEENNIVLLYFFKQFNKKGLKMESGEISAMVLTAIVMMALAFISFKIGKNIADKKK